MHALVPALAALWTEALRAAFETWESDAFRLMVLGLTLLAVSTVVRSWFFRDRATQQKAPLSSTKPVVGMTNHVGVVKGNARLVRPHVGSLSYQEPLVDVPLLNETLRWTEQDRVHALK